MTGRGPSSRPSIVLSRGLLRGSARASREEPPLLRDGTSGQTDEEHLELPLSGADLEEPSTVRVLHVDDNPEILEVSKVFLEKIDEDFTVNCVTSVVAALNELQNDEFDCIVSDYEMPNTDGLEFLEIVRERYPDLPFILYTAKGSEAVASDAISAGVTEYMQKETSSEQYEVLANRIRKAVERYRSRQQFWDALSWYHRIIERDMAGVFIVQSGEFVYVNERLAGLLGYLQSELLGEPPETLAAAESDAEQLDTLLAPSGEGRDRFSGEFTAEAADGSAVPVEVHGGPIQYEEEPARIGILWSREESS